MTKLQLQILRALDEPMRGAALVDAMPGVSFAKLADALRGAKADGWIAVEHVTGGMLWYRTTAGTEALAATAALPLDPADERAAERFAEPPE